MVTSWTEIALEKAPLEIIDGDRGTNYPKQSDFSNSGYCLFLNTGNVTTSGFNFSSCSFINPERDAALRKGRVQRGDVLLTTRGTVGNTAWFDETVPYSVIRINSGMVILRPNTEELHPEFLYFFIRSPKFRKQVDALRSGTAQPQLPIRDLKGIEIPLPPLEDQRRIATILDKADAVRRKRKEAIALTEELLRSAFLEMFGDPVTNPKGWEVKPLIQLIDPKRPITYGILKPGPDIPSGIPYVRVVEMKNSTVDSSIVRRTTPEIAKQYSRSTLISGDLLLSIRGHVGRLAITPSDLNGANITQDTARLAVGNLLTTEFLFALLDSHQMRNWMKQRIKGAGVQGINLGDVKEIPTPIPSMLLQEKFSAIFRRIRVQQERDRDREYNMDNLFNSLLQRAFRGEL